MVGRNLYSPSVGSLDSIDSLEPLKTVFGLCTLPHLIYGAHGLSCGGPSIDLVLWTSYDLYDSTDLQCPLMGL